MVQGSEVTLRGSRVRSRVWGPGSGFRGQVRGLVSRVWGLVSRIWGPGSGFGAQGQDSGVQVQDSGVQVQGLGVRVQELGLGFGVQVQGSGPAASKAAAGVAALLLGPWDTLSVCCDIVRLHWGELQPLQSVQKAALLRSTWTVYVISHFLKFFLL